ncbi:MAG: DNA polymerase III subunit delta, partial [Cyclobacteriaceae bacterium]|nr:DNA polymerase III subunit delta [Cyclobacteriaceae bacterium]
MATKDKGGTGYLDIIKQIKGKNFSPVYFLQGDEPYFIDLITKEIESTVLSEAEKSFNQTILYGRDVNMSTVLSQARRFPMMSPYQVVIVKEAQHLADLGKEEGIQSFLSYLSNPVPTTILVFCFLGKKLDGRQALSKQIAKSGILFTSNTIYENQVPEWVNAYVASKKIRISNKANAMLSEYLGNNLERISNELEKIMLNLGGATEINETHVEKYVGVNKDYNFFELQKALLFRNNEKVFKILNYFEANEK